MTRQRRVRSQVGPTPTTAHSPSIHLPTMATDDSTSSPPRAATSSSGTVKFTSRTQPEPLPRQKKNKRKPSGMPEGVSISEQPGDRNMEGMEEEEDHIADSTEVCESPTEERPPEGST
ncbi:hypothetical protein MVEN_00231700 [Mycena venus]|uniref:Uncharacterized protein n=1 Tax=Mycena venus TaxID=2733690 RepID=A0A8H6Z225_9AGAR|nr:hypothetical protein MVEN_00231700 [Mycena venus]